MALPGRPKMFMVRTYHLWNVRSASSRVAAVVGEPLDPELAVADVHPLFLEDTLDAAPPGAVGRVPHVLELVPCPAVHAEVEHHEVRPGVDRIVEDVDALVRGDAGRPDVGLRVVEPAREALVVGSHVGADVHAELLEEVVHHLGVAGLVLHDLGDDELLLDARRLHDPGHVPVGAGELRVGLHGHEVNQVVAVGRAHLVLRFDALASRDPGEQALVACAFVGHGSLPRRPSAGPGRRRRSGTG